MATALQIAANRRNATLSTGPTSPSGKAVSSRNSTRHGLTAAPSHDEFERRKAEWRAEFDPQGPEEEHLLDELAAASIRVAPCTDAYLALVADHGRRAATQWDADRRREADATAAGLGKRPHEVARKLEATPQGCDLKSEWWSGLGSALEADGAWTDAQRSLALVLLGVRRERATPPRPSTRPRATSSRRGDSSSPRKSRG